MGRIRLLTLGLLVLGAVTLRAGEPLKAGQEGKLEVPGGKYPCVLSVPTDYVPGTKYPLIMHMHGAGGSPTTSPMKEATGGKGYFIVGLSYGALADGGTGKLIDGEPGSCQAMIKFIDQVRQLVADQYPIDQKRVFLSGLSMGGWGVNFYGFKPAAKKRFRGYCIIAAAPATHWDGIEFSVAEGLPVLVLNGEKDENTVEANKNMPLIKKAGALVTQVIVPNEGHVPPVETMVGPIRDWLAEVAKVDARNLALAAVRWQEAALAGSPAKGVNKVALLAEFLKGQSFLAEVDGQRPILLFFHAAGQEADQPGKSAVVEEKVFSFPAACDTPVASRSFTCFRIDVSAIDPKENQLVNRNVAPLVVLLKPDQSLALALFSSQIRDQALAKGMLVLLSPEEKAKAGAALPQVRAVLQQMVRQKAKIDAQLANIAKLAKKDAKGADAKIATLRDALKADEDEYEKLRGKLAEPPAPTPADAGEADATK